MRGYYTPQQIRAAEAPLLEALPDGTLMRRAAYGLAVVVARELASRTGAVAGRRVTVLVGSGDNGGDGLWAGTYLRRRGVAVSALLLDPARAHAKGLAAFRSSGGRVVAELGDPDIVVDAIVGISGKGPLRPAAAAVVDRISAPIVSVDVPSGVDAETGAVLGSAVSAEVTVTFGGRKPAHVLAVPQCGAIELVDIGLTLPKPEMRSLEPSDVGRHWPLPVATDDKYSQGVVGVLAGGAKFPGAALLCVGAAVAATSGMVRYVGGAAAEVISHYPEVVAAPDLDSVGKVQAWVVGPGFGTDDESARTVRRVLESDLPVVVDADALTVLARNRDWVIGRTAPTLLTPHAGEFARLAGVAPGSDRVGAVRNLAASWGVTVLLKGRATIVADADGTTFVDDAGGSAASTAGSGDVLSGMVGALLASGQSTLTAAACAVRVHALAAAQAAGGSSGQFAAPISATPLCAAIRGAIRTVRSVTGQWDSSRDAVCHELCHPEPSARGLGWHYRMS